jgi:hypothetical protein
VTKACRGCQGPAPAELRGHCRPCLSVLLLEAPVLLRELPRLHVLGAWKACPHGQDFTAEPERRAGVAQALVAACGEEEGFRSRRRRSGPEGGYPVPKAFCLEGGARVPKAAFRGRK